MASTSGRRIGIDTPEHFPLFKLPGELRNRIYRLSLLEQSRIQVTPAGLGEPGLLLSCHQARNEAAPIFYSENEFIIHFPRYDSSICDTQGQGAEVTIQDSRQ